MVRKTLGKGRVWGLRGVLSPCSLTLKKNKKLCVAPEAPWIQLLIYKLTQRYTTPSDHKTGSVPNVLAGLLDLHPFPPPKTCRNSIKKEASARPRRDAERWAGGAERRCRPPRRPPAPSLPLSGYHDK